jgi:hypothetical protein
MAISLDQFCYTTMSELGDVSLNGDVMRRRQPIGLLDALRSESNTTGTEVDRQYDRGDGKAAKVYLRYLKPDALSDSTDTITNLCDENGNQTAYNYDEVDLPFEVQSDVKLLTQNQHRELCETGNEFRSKIIAGMINSVNRRINRTLIAAYYNGAGGLVGGNGTVGTSYNMLYRSGLTQIDPEGYFQMIEDVTLTGLAGSPLLVGAGNLKKYLDLKGIACCNEFGQDNSRLGDLNAFYDVDIQAILGTPSAGGTNFFAFAPGAAQFVDKPFNAGDFREVHEHYLYDTITDPATGITYDFNMQYDICNRNWKWVMQLRFGLYQLPLDMFKSTDDRFKVNYNWAFRAGITDCGGCPSNEG